MKRIEQETPRLSREAIEARRQEMEAECKAVMAHLSHRVWLARLPLLLDVLGLISLTFAVWGILRSMPESRSILEGLGPLTARVGTDSMAWIWTVICLLIGLVCVFKPRPVIRL